MRRIGLLACSFMLGATGCSGGGGSSATPPGGALVPQTSSVATDTSTSAAGTDTLAAHQTYGSPIAHVVIVIQENRTFDNIFNGYPGSDTAQSGKTHTGAAVPLQPVPFEEPPDPSHERSSLLTEYDNGKMDGFDLDPVSATVAGGPTFPTPNTFVYAYVPQAETLPYWQMAQHYALADHMFSSQIAPSFPGHEYLIAGQSGRAIGDPVNATNPQVNAVWGCDSPSGSTVETLDSHNNVVTPGPFPCFDYKTLGDLLDAKKIGWKYYTGFSNGLDLDGQVSAYDAIRHIRYGNDWNTKISSPEYTFFSDVNARTLPAVSWITPPAAASDHAGTLNSSGPSWVTAVVNAIQQSPSYASNTAIFITWDDSGGWYDHVAPPPGFGDGISYGFRVPLIVVSPYAKSGYVSHVTHDFGSILHFVENNWRLGSLGTVDSRADALADMFEYNRKPAPPVTFQAQFSLTAIAALKPTQPVDSDR